MLSKLLTDHEDSVVEMNTTDREWLEKGRKVRILWVNVLEMIR